MHRQGALQLILSLPDGGTSMIPAVWTDVGGFDPPAPSARVLGSIADLMHMRRVVDALLRRWDLAIKRPAEQEDPHATGTVSHTPTVGQAASRPGPSESDRPRNIGQDIGAATRQNHHVATERTTP